MTDRFSPSATLHAWECALAQGEAGGRARVLLAFARPELTPVERGRLPMSARDRELLGLHLALFGPVIEGRTACPACGESLELDLDGRALLEPAERLAPGTSDVVELRQAGWSAQVRLPTVADLAATATLPAPLEARHRALLERLVVGATFDGAACTFEDLPDSMLAALEDALEEADVQALPRFEVVCDACAHRWTPVFDAAEFVWIRLNAWATRLLWEVHALARGYAWSEDVLVNMSPWRRQRYLEMLGA